MKTKNNWIANLLLAIPSRQQTLVIASSGRSGSTLLFDATAQAMSRARFGLSTRYTSHKAWDLNAASLKPGMVYKTHDYPDALAHQEGVRSVFVFGSATDNVMSTLKQEQVKGRSWVNVHLAHLKSTGSFDEILQKDVLGIMDQITSWSTFEASPILCVRYDALWDVQAKIQEFTGLPIELPERRLRRPKELSSAVMNQIEETYGTIDAKISQLPDVYLSSKSMGHQLTSA